MSYGDSYRVGVDTDPAAIPDPELLTRYRAATADEIEDCAVPQPTPGGAEAEERRQKPETSEPATGIRIACLTPSLQRVSPWPRR